jgi:hypothetical protein
MLLGLHRKGGRRDGRMTGQHLADDVVHRKKLARAAVTGRGRRWLRRGGHGRKQQHKRECTKHGFLFSLQIPG